jgi:hypothetical protein
LWAVGDEGTILESSDGEHWNARTSGTTSDLRSVYGTRDGKPLWAVGAGGTILEAMQQGVAPFIREAHLKPAFDPVSNFASLEIDVRPGTRQQRPDQITVKGRNDYDEQQGHPWQKDAPCEADYTSSLWRCRFELSALHPEVSRKLHFLLHVEREGGTDVYEFATRHDPWALIREHRTLLGASAIVVALLVCFTVLLVTRPLWNLKIYRLLKLNHIDKINIPGLGDIPQIIFRFCTVLPWFVRHRRTLDAWVTEHRASLRQAWESEIGLVSPRNFDDSSVHMAIYVPLPIRVADPLSGDLVSQPTPNDVRKMIKGPRSTLQIIGPGGTGKTTLARQIGQWALDYGPQSGLSENPMLPVWIDEELDSEKNPLTAAVKGKLTAALPNEEIEDELFSALLRQQRLLVFVDRISERSAITQRHVETIYRSARIGLLILTSRTSRTIDGAQSVNIYPQPLNSSTLLHFMTSLLSVFLAEDGGLRGFSNVQEQLKLGERLAALIGRTNKGEEDISLIPLPVRLFVEQAVQLVRDGKGLNELPVSLPEVYFRHLRMVNPQDPTVTHFTDNDRMLKIAKVLGKVALGKDYIPREFSRQEAIGALQDAGESVSANFDPIERLKLNGVLIEKQRMYVLLRFALDPIAEFLAAAAYAEDCGPDSRKWETLLSESELAPGFQSALKLVRQAFAEHGGWARPIEDR